MHGRTDSFGNRLSSSPRVAQGRASRCFECNPRHIRTLGSLSLPAAKRGFVRCASFSHLLAVFTQHRLALAPAGRRSDVHPIERRSSHLALLLFYASLVSETIRMRHPQAHPKAERHLQRQREFNLARASLRFQRAPKAAELHAPTANLSSALVACQFHLAQSTLRHAQLQPSGIQPPSHFNLQCYPARPCQGSSSSSSWSRLAATSHHCLGRCRDCLSQSASPVFISVGTIVSAICG